MSDFDWTDLRAFVTQQISEAIAAEPDATMRAKMALALDRMVDLAELCVLRHLVAQPPARPDEITPPRHLRAVNGNDA